MNRKVTKYLVLPAVLCALLLVIPAGAQSGNLLQNPGFEGEYYCYENSGELQVAEGWVPWWHPGDSDPPSPGGGSSGPMRRPEYKPLPETVDILRVRSGERAQAYFVFYGVMDAGVYQTVPAAEGQFYQGYVYAQQWTDKGDNPDVSRGEMYFSVGIDPLGGTDPNAIHVQWSAWQPGSWVRGGWSLIMSPVAQAKADQMTMYVRAWHKWSLRHGDAYIDDAALYVVDVESEPVPTATPLPTYTPYPTHTPIPITPCPTCVPGDGCDYDEIMNRVRQVVREELDNTHLSH